MKQRQRNNEKRRHPRADLWLPVQVVSPEAGRRIASGNTINVSPGGVLAECDGQGSLDEGETILVRFGRQASPDPPGRTGFRARVVRVVGTSPLRFAAQVVGSEPGCLLAPELVGLHPSIVALKKQIHAIAGYDVNVLIRGESGTGKNVAARLIHRYSDRASGPLMRVNCPAIPETLLESQLFGHERGAFTGASSKQAGLFRAADGGTIILDEISAVPSGLQAKLLHAIEEKSFIPVGAQRAVHADFRVVATTNDDLEALVADSEFRADLYYRLNEIELELPPLRDRKCDIPLLAENFMREQCRRLGSDYRPLEGETLRLLQDYDWPGNVRELQNVIKRGVILGQFRPRRHARSNGNGAKKRSAPEPAPRSLEEASELAEKRALVRALEMTDGHRGHAAEELGVSYRTLLRRMKKYDIHFTPEPVG